MVEDADDGEGVCICQEVDRMAPDVGLPDPRDAGVGFAGLFTAAERPDMVADVGEVAHRLFRAPGVGCVVENAVEIALGGGQQEQAFHSAFARVAALLRSMKASKSNSLAGPEASP